MRVWIFVYLVSLGSCTGVYKAKKVAEYISLADTNFVIKDTHNISTTFSYSGCGGFYIENNGAGVLIDPYFSNIGPMIFVKSKELSTDSSSIEAYFSKIDTSNIRFLLTGHTHIDHVGDYPFIYNRYISSNVKLVGNKTLHFLMSGLKNYPKGDSVIYDKTGNWIYSMDSLIRVMPIESEHAPHFLGMKVAPVAPLKKPVNKFPVKSKNFPEGVKHNFVIDFLKKDGAVLTRVFSSAAAAAKFPVGMPNKDVLKDHPVDVLLLCGASYQYAKRYPEHVVSMVLPKFILVSHWENFFQPWEELRNKPKVVPFTNMKKLIRKLEESDSSPLFVLPNVGTSIEVHH